MAHVTDRLRNEDLWGTHRLINVTLGREENGERVETLVTDIDGYITYGSDGRMMTIVSYHRNEFLQKMLDDDPRIDRAGRTATSYGGTYRFRGDRVEHVVDICDDPAFLGIVVTREVSRGEGRVHYTMMNGASSECVRWEKVGDVAIDDQTA